MKVFFNDGYVAPGHGADTTRKSGEIAAALATGRVPTVELADPVDLVDQVEQLVPTVHSEAYVNALKTGRPTELAESQGFGWDEGIWEMAANSTAGVLAATNEALAIGGPSGSLSSGLHHARRANGAGYCTVNGLAVAANHATEQVDGTVVVLDVDAHCGGGTNELIGDNQRILHLDLSTNGFDHYQPKGNDKLLVLGSRTDEAYLDHVDWCLDRVPKDSSLVIYNAGMDPHPSISAEGLAERERRVANWCANHAMPVAWVLAGGYTWSISMDQLVDLHLHTSPRSRPPSRTGCHRPFLAFAPKPRTRSLPTTATPATTTSPEMSPRHELLQRLSTQRRRQDAARLQRRRQHRT